MDGLAEVNNTCYKIKINLNENDLKMIKTAITNLKVAWIIAGLSITVKSHNLFEHGYDFMAKFLVTLGVLSAQDGESIHRLYRLIDAFYPSHLSRELPFKRFNAERFLPLPTSSSNKRIRPDKNAESSSNTTEHQLNEEVSEFIQGLIHEAENDESTLNASIAEITLVDEDDEVGEDDSVNDDEEYEYCHVGDEFDLNFDVDGVEFGDMVELADFDEL